VIDSVENISSSAFKSLKNLTTFTVGGSVSLIDSSAFAGCTELTEVSINSFDGIIGSSAFEGCTSLTSFKITGTKGFGNRAFYNCGFTSLEIDDTVEEIGSYAFYSSMSLTELFIPASVTSISSQAFASSSNLVLVQYKGRQDPGENSNAFSGCYKFDEVIVPETYANATFCGKKVKKTHIPVSSSDSSVTSSGSSTHGSSSHGGSSHGKTSSSHGGESASVSSAPSLKDGFVHFIVSAVVLLSVLVAQC